MKNIKLLETPILLASASPRRQYLLQEAGFSIRVIPPELEETYPAEIPVEEIPVYLALRKAEILVPQIRNNEIILAADSIVVLSGNVMGKPADRSSAFGMLRALSGKSHLVITGVCLLDRIRKMTFSSTSEVTFHDISESEIEYYVDKFEPYDKAGSYGVQEWIGWCKIREIKGSYSNIMGLPMAMVYEKLNAFTQEL